MISSTLSRKIVPALTRIGSQPVRQSHDDAIPWIGTNLPFSVTNKYTFALKFILFIGTGFSLPFLIARRLTKKTK